MDEMMIKRMKTAAVKLKKVHEAMICSMADIMAEAIPDADIMSQAETLEYLMHQFTAEDIYYILQYHNFQFPGTGEN